MKLLEIAKQLDLTFKGDGSTEVKQFCSLDNPKDNAISYVRDKKHLKLLKNKNISVVILTPDDAQDYSGNCIVHLNPYYVFAIVSRLLNPDESAKSFTHSSAVIDKTSILANNVSIGANCVIEKGVVIGKNATIQPGCVIAKHTHIGDNAYLFPNVTINHSTQIGDNVRIQSGAVIAGEGFGYARYEDGWSRIAQAGCVIIGNNVEIGANTTIDRGAIDNTIIEDNVILDNHIQIGHNVKVGKNTAMASSTAIAGSTIIGENCTFGGCSAVVGHLNITDNVHITAKSFITKSINQAGQYSSGGLFQKSSDWRKNAIRFKQLDILFSKLKNKGLL